MRYNDSVNFQMAEGRNDKVRELSVYYCPGCGHYSYYQLPRYAVCPKCRRKMTRLSLPLQKFLDLDCQKRDHLLAYTIMKQNPYLQDYAGTYKEFDCQETMKKMEAEAEALEAENEDLRNTAYWMGQMLEELKKTGSGSD